MAAELHTEGLQYLLEVAFSEEQTVPANFYVGLATDTSLDEDASLSDITEVSGDGYDRQTVASDNADWTSASTGVDDWKVTSATVTFSATGTWTTAKTVFLATTDDDSGVLIASSPLSESITLADGEGMTVAFEIDLTG